MNKKDLIGDIREYAVDDLGASIEKTFQEFPVKSATDPHWLMALDLYGRLNKYDRQIVISIVNHAAVSTVSRVLGYLDGEVGNRFDRDLVLTDLNGAKLNGDLQTEFLIDEERRERNRIKKLCE